MILNAVYRICAMYKLVVKISGTEEECVKEEKPI